MLENVINCAALSSRDRGVTPGKSSMMGVVCVVTGATSGIGLETVVALASRGATVTAVGRNTERCSQADEILRRRLPEARIEFETANLASLGETKRLATRLRERYPSVDVLINNAAIFSSRRILTEDGQELQFAVNYLSAFALTVALLPALTAGSNGRMINVGSGSHHLGRIRWQDLTLGGCYRPLRAYGQSKLAGILFSYELAMRYAGVLTVAVADPGLTNTGLGLKQTGPLARLIWRRRRLGGADPSVPAAEIADLAGSATLVGQSGLYWTRGKPILSSHSSYNPDDARRLWLLSEKLCELGGSAGS